MIWGIDLGGTKIEGAILRSVTDSDPVCRIRHDTEKEKGYGHIIERISLLVRKIEDATGLKPEAIGFGTPGTVDPPTGLMKNCNTTCLNGQPLLADLRKALGVPIEIVNDANCFALAETLMGAARGCDVVFGTIMGTGVGGGLIVNGKMVRGAQGIAGEWGHNFLDPDGPPCYCGKQGCVENCISGPATAAYYAHLTGTSLPLKEIYQRHLDGSDASATATIERLCEKFGEAISVVLNIVDPEAVVLGGGVGNIDELLTWGVDSVKRHVFNNRLDTRFLKPILGDSAGVFGAAMLVA